MVSAAANLIVKQSAKTTVASPEPNEVQLAPIAFSKYDRSAATYLDGA
jgi:hypothetical protein